MISPMITCANELFVKATQTSTNAVVMENSDFTKLISGTTQLKNGARIS
jgi:hypothetical protein